MATIALVDDDRNILTSVSIALESEGYRVETYTDGASALEGLSARPPNLAILDIKMPRMDGMELLRRLRQKSDLPVIFLTSKDDEIDELFGLKMGADDFIKKPFSQRLLVERVRAVLRRGGELPQPQIYEQRGLRLDLDRHVVTRGGQPIELTPTEFDLLKTLMAFPGHAFTRAELIEKGLGYTYDGLDRGVDSHIKNLRKKIEPDLLHPIYIQTVYGVGYRFGD